MMRRATCERCAVYRYYCRNQECPRQSFTHLPPDLVPYSRYRLEVHLLALQTYTWSYSTYRRVGQALQVSEMTVYRWVSAWGHELLPVAALFGLVRSSGVVGVDEKYVLVPKSDKPEGKMRCWMYVYLAVDVYTYDLLHIAVYPHNTSRAPTLSCWRCGPRATARRSSSPICAGTMARLSPRCSPMHSITSACSTPNRRSISGRPRAATMPNSTP